MPWKNDDINLIRFAEDRNHFTRTLLHRKWKIFLVIVIHSFFFFYIKNKVTWYIKVGKEIIKRIAVLLGILLILLMNI